MSESTTAPPRRVAPFVAGAVAVVIAVLFGVLLVVEPSSDTAETVLLDRTRVLPQWRRWLPVAA